MLFRIVGFIAICSLAAACHHAAQVREEAEVRLGGAHERWRLEWRSRTKEVCMPESDGFVTCPCTGFAYGEMGRAALVRTRANGQQEELPLGPLFADEENPAESAMAIFQRWPVADSDFAINDSLERVRRIESRTPVSLMSLADYDHDGEATEFLLQVGTAPCGKREAMLVGVSASQPKLHAFTSVAHPSTPLVLEDYVWKSSLLAGASPMPVLEIACGDHGAETRTEVRLRATPAGLDGERLTYECRSDGSAGKLLTSEAL